VSERAHETATLLLVEDNRVNRLLLTRLVEQLGHKVMAVENGRQALECLVRQRFDLMLLDIEMPELDGFGLLELLLKDPRHCDMPVIVTSGLDGVANVVRCIELGAEDYLHKPVNPVLLRARLNASLEKKRLRDEQRELVRRFATAEVAQDMERSGFALGGRALRASVMFCDIRGFTSLVEAQPPEDVIELLNSYYMLMFDAINSHGGVVNQMIGDGLMALFGAPLPLAGHCGCAVSAAREMIAMAAQFSAEQLAQGKPAVQIGIGIATGDVVAGYTGTRERATYTCVGDTVNLAARLEAHTKEARRAVLIDAATRAELGAEVQPEALGSLLFKGKSTAVDVYAVSATF
jgi:adenylate cyclase